MEFIYSEYADKQSRRMPKKDLKRVDEKLEFLKENPQLLKTQLGRIYNLEPATHRLCIGSWRLLLSVDGGKYVILKIARRREIYN